MNVTSEVDSGPRLLGPEYHRQIRVVVLGAMILVSCFGNLAVFIHTCSAFTGQRRNRVQVLFFHLALADLLVTLFTMVSQLIWECLSLAWFGGYAGCPLFKVLQTFALVASNYMLLAIAADRYLAVMRPLEPRPRATTLAIAAWTASTLPALPNAYVFQVVTLPSGETFCVAKFYTSSLSPLCRQLYMGLIFLLVFVVPIVLLVVLNGRIILLLWTRARAPDIRRGTSLTDGRSAVGYIPKAKVKTLKLTLVVVAAFLTTCLPYLVQEMILAFGDPSVLNQNVVALTGIVSASNSCLNPYIYMAFNWTSSERCRLCTGNVLWRWSGSDRRKERSTNVHRTDV